MRPPMTPEQAHAMLVMAEGNDRASHLFNIVLGAAVAAFLLFTAPAAATWASTHRLAEGWTLKKLPASKRDDDAVAIVLGGSADGVADEKYGGSGEVRMTVQAKPILRTATMPSWLSVNLRTGYNKLFLRPLPFSSYVYGQALVLVGYVVVFLFCLLFDTPSLKSNWRRPGCIAAAQLPWLFLFATKNNLLALIGMGYEKLNWLHRLAGRLVILAGLLHTVLFLRIAPLHVHEPVHLSGLICAVASAVLLLTSFPLVRRTCYQLFLVSHIAGWITFVVALAFHVPTFARPYVAAAITLYALDALSRVTKTRLASATISALPGGMTRLDSTDLKSGWRAGQHVWLRTWCGAGWHRSWETHPFTIAAAPGEASPLKNRSLTLLVKSTGRFTRGLSQRSSPLFDYRTKVTIPCAVEGPYGGFRFLDFAEVEAVILLAGGSGITSCLPVLEELIYLASAGRCATRIVTLVWTVRALDNLEWCREVLSELVQSARDKTELKVRISLHVTMNQLAAMALPAPLASPIPHSTLSLTRPDLSAIMNAHLAGLAKRADQCGRPRGGALGVGVCGPPGMVRSARQTVANVSWSKSTLAGGIRFHSETFGW